MQKDDTMSHYHSHIDSYNDQNEERANIHRRFRVSLAILTVAICSYTVHMTTTQTLRHSRNLHRTLNSQILNHDDQSIYWFGYRDGQHLINYPIHEYYDLVEFGQFLNSMEEVMANLQMHSFGVLDQANLNKTEQRIVMLYSNGTYNQYKWTIQQGLTLPFTSDDRMAMKKALINCFTMQINIENLVISGQSQTQPKEFKWNIKFVIQPFSQTSIIVTIVMQEIMYLGKRHIPHLIVGLMTILLIWIELKERQNKRRRKAISRTNYLNFYTYKYILYKFRPSDTPDFLVAFFLMYSSMISFSESFTLSYMLLIDGVTCFISWLYILKLYTENDEFHISILIRKSYIFVGRLFVSFGPLFIGFCLFALTAFCRYSTLFQDFHKTFISLFCVCYYNMTYEEYRTTERANPISTIFLTLLIMLFTVCIYSGMLVSVFCSYMWNKRDKKNKQQLLASLKIQCAACNCKYGYVEGYKTSLKMSIGKRDYELMDEEDTPGSHARMKNIMKEKIQFFTSRILQHLKQNSQIVEGFIKEDIGEQIEQVYVQNLLQMHRSVKDMIINI